MQIGTNKNEKEKNNLIQKTINDSILSANAIADSGELFEAGEFLYSITELLEKIASVQSAKLYKLIIKFLPSEKLLSKDIFNTLKSKTRERN